MTPSSRDALAKSLADRYVIEREIGVGGMATVYLARDLKHDRPVALKVLKPELGAVLGVDRFLSEIKVTANLQHPNLLPLFDSGDAAGFLFYVMPFVEGESLRARLDRERQLPVEEAVRLAAAVAGALEYAHRHGVIHRDLKPENILLQAGQPVVADFGIALAVSNAGGVRLTQTGMSLGTPQYMSPEQAGGDRVIDSRTDIYSLGAVTYEMLVGEPPHAAMTAQAIIAKLMTEDVRPLAALRRSVPPHVDAAIRQALEKLPADRFATAADFALALTGARPMAMASGRSGGPPGPGARRWPTWLPLVVAMGVLALGAEVVALRVGSRPPAPLPSVFFTVSLPDSVSFFRSPGGKLAISRDGSRLVMIGVKGGVRAIYLRRIDEPSVEVVRGTEADDASPAAPRDPAFSPDGDWIVFGTVGSGIRRVPVGGGAPQLLADSARVGSLGDRGTLLWVRDDALWLAAPDGRGPRRLALPDTTHGVFGFSFPRILPGSEDALVTLDHRGFSLDSLGLGLVSLRDGTVTDLGMAGMDAHYTETGHLVFGRPGGFVYSASFSPRNRTTTGPAVLLLENVWQGGSGATGVDVSDNGTLVFRRADKSQRELVAVNGAGLERSIAGPPSDYQFPRVSPDGRRVAVGTLASGLWLVDVGSGARERPAPDFNRIGWADWTRDGARLLMIRPVGRQHEIVSRAFDRSGEDRILFRDSTEDLLEVAIGPPAGYGAIRAGLSVTKSADIFIAPMDRLGAMRPVAASPGINELAPSISADGRYLAYSSDESGNNEIYVRPIPGPGARLQISARGGTEPVWSRTGTTVFFRGPARIMAAELGGTPLRVQRRDSLFVDAFDRSQAGYHRNWDLFPNGKEFLMLRTARSSSATVSVVLNWPQGRRPRPEVK